MSNLISFLFNSTVMFWLERIFFAGLILFIGWWLINRFSKVYLVFFQKASLDKGLVSFFDSVIRFLLRLLLFVGVLDFLGFKTTSIVAAIGASFIAIGISLKDSLANVVSGIILIINKPVHAGDYVEFDGIKGKIIKIEMLFSFVQPSEEDKVIVVPNSKLISSNILRKSEYNWESIKTYEEVLPNSKVKDFKKYLEKEIFLSKNILQIPAPEITIENKEDKIGITLNLWCESQNKKEAQKEIEKIKEKFHKKYDIKLS
ncbi:MAG: mechanosensitive ion channel [Clostridia bacterium]|nr:mechanosensitive ion channel [Clostridia bacterium]